MQRNAENSFPFRRAVARRSFYKMNSFFSMLQNKDYNSLYRHRFQKQA
ncbi:MAG: hypothetical protein LEGION0403_FIIPPAGN_00629 [Legionella sp.]